MKRNTNYLIFIAAAGICGAVLRGISLLNGYEADTGLPVEGYLPATILVALTAVVILLAMVFSHISFRKYNGCAYEQLFDQRSKGACLCSAAAAAGMIVFSALALKNMPLLIVEQSSKRLGELIDPGFVITSAMTLIWVLSLLSGLFLLLLAVRQMRGGEVKKLDGICVTVPMFWCCLDLIMIYHENSGNPVISEYAYLLLAVVSVMTIFHSIGSFLFSENTSAVRYFAAAGAGIYLMMTHIGGTVIEYLLSGAEGGMFAVVGAGNTLRAGVYACAAVYLTLLFVHALRRCGEKTKHNEIAAEE